VSEGPSRRLDPKARTLWRVHGTLFSPPVLAAGGGGSWALLERAQIPPWLAFSPGVAAAALALVLVTVLPPARWHRWRYEVRGEEVDLERGVLWRRRTLVPLSRVQHVDTKSGPLQRRFGLATVEIYTAAGSEEIPQLAVSVADELRENISALAQTHDVL